MDFLFDVPVGVVSRSDIIALMYFVYILLCKGGSLYTGIARDPQKRFREHRNGNGGAYTRSHKPIRIVYTERKRTKSAALKREAEIKRWNRQKKIKTLRLSSLPPHPSTPARRAWG